MNRLFTRNVLLITAFALLNHGCLSAPKRLNAVPHELTARAEIPGMPDVRFVPGDGVAAFVKVAVEMTRNEQAYRASQGLTGPLPQAVFLAISGGGDNGAFTAGLLNGWTEAGTRPEFKLVTGISTGALIAPFAFLGPKYDATLKEGYTTISPKDVISAAQHLQRGFRRCDGRQRAVWKLTRKTVNADLLKAVAAEYAKGRGLLVATADIDARRPIIWNMGKIASYGTPKALDLFISVMIASASIPGGLPPVMIDAEVDGKHYQEMHVDGGTMAQVFAYPAAVSAEQMAAATGLTRERTLYVIRNARLDPDWAKVERSTMSIAGRAVRR